MFMTMGIFVALILIIAIFYTNTQQDTTYNDVPFQSPTPPEGSAGIYQALVVTDINGNIYWYYPPSPISTMTLVDFYKEVEIVNIQTVIYMHPNYPTSKTVSSWTFNTQGKFSITDENQNTLQVLGDMPIGIQGTTLLNKQPNIITSASSPAYNLEQSYSLQSGHTYYYKVELGNININIQFDDGSSIQLSAYPTSDNILHWRFTTPLPIDEWNRDTSEHQWYEFWKYIT